jgi:hypothetical protein
MRPGGRLGLQNRMRPVLRRVGWVRFPCTPAIRYRLDFRIQRRFVTLRRFIPPTAALIAAIVAATAVARAQPAVPASTPRALSPADTVRSPISPKRAFLTSLLFPGSAQNVLGRHRAAAALVAVEGISIAMIRESGADLREARQQLGDSLVVSYVDENGARLATPTLQRRRFEDVEVRSRRSHVEDWVALLIANHLFAACDAFVSANLWDVPAHVTIKGSRDRVLIGGQLSW